MPCGADIDVIVGSGGSKSLQDQRGRGRGYIGRLHQHQLVIRVCYRLKLQEPWSLVTKGCSVTTHVLSLGVDADEAITGLLLAESIGDVLSVEILLPVEPFWFCILLFMLERRLKRINQLGIISIINQLGTFFEWDHFIMN